ncbi:hypothetical protein Pelo_9536 [Pelomyxa schiedti]|nr:hypothetical protein Pelo_9536 [Pelomyxa schiedti]
MRGWSAVSVRLSVPSSSSHLVSQVGAGCISIGDDVGGGDPGSLVCGCGVAMDCTAAGAAAVSSAQSSPRRAQVLVVTCAELFGPWLRREERGPAENESGSGGGWSLSGGVRVHVGRSGSGSGDANSAARMGQDGKCGGGGGGSGRERGERGEDNQQHWAEAQLVSVRLFQDVAQTIGRLSPLQTAKGSVSLAPTGSSVCGGVAVLTLRNDCEDRGLSLLGIQPVDEHSIGPELRSLQSGQRVYSLVAPYSLALPGLLSGLMASGIVANVLTGDSMLPSTPSQSGKISPTSFIVDIWCLPGTEGAPVFSQTGTLLGIMLQSLHTPLLTAGSNTTSGKEATKPSTSEQSVHGPGPFSLVLPINRLLPNLAVLQQTSFIDKIMLGTVLVLVHIPFVDTIWGTGVVVTKSGHVLTNAHLLAFNSHKNYQVSVRLPKPDGRHIWKKAIPVWVSRQSHRDIAVLRVLDITNGEDDLNVVPITQTAPTLGSHVIAIGYHTFPPHSNISTPSCTTGVFAKMIRDPQSGKDVMFVMSGMLHGGSSGGVIVDEKSGEVCALIVASVHLNSIANSGTVFGGGNVGVGMALPLSIVSAVVNICKNSPATAPGDAAISTQISSLNWGTTLLEETVWACGSTPKPPSNSAPRPKL